MIATTAVFRKCSLVGFLASAMLISILIFPERCTRFIQISTSVRKKMERQSIKHGEVTRQILSCSACVRGWSLRLTVRVVSERPLLSLSVVCLVCSLFCVRYFFPIIQSGNDIFGESLLGCLNLSCCWKISASLYGAISYSCSIVSTSHYTQSTFRERNREFAKSHKNYPFNSYPWSSLGGTRKCPV